MYPCTNMTIHAVTWEPAWPQVSPRIQCITSLKLVCKSERYEVDKGMRRVGLPLSSATSLCHSCNFNIPVLYRSINWEKKLSKFNANSIFICCGLASLELQYLPSLFKKSYRNTKSVPERTVRQVAEKTPTCFFKRVSILFCNHYFSGVPHRHKWTFSLIN